MAFLRLSAQPYRHRAEASKLCTCSLVCCQQHGDQHRAYARDLRQFVRDAAALSQSDQHQVFLDRRETQQTNSDASPGPPGAAPLATFGLGIAGSAVALTYGNPIGAGLTAAGALLGLRRQADPASAYTYLFQAQQHLSAPHRR